MKQLKKVTRRQRELLWRVMKIQDVTNIRFVMETKYEYVFFDLVKNVEFKIPKM